MTNPISVGSTIVSPSAPAIALEKSGAPGASGFAVLLEGTASGARQNPANVIGAPAASPETLLPEAQALDLQALFGALGELFDQLVTIEQGIADDLPIDGNALETLAGLLETINGLLDTGAVIDPDSPFLAQLRGLAETLGIEMKAEATGPATVLETLAALATRIGAELRQTAPELATALTGLAARLDTHIAAIETAHANAGPDAATMLKLVDSETKPNASAAIARNDTAAQATPDKPADTGQPQPDKSARTDQTSRSLAGDGDQTRSASPAAQSNAQANNAAAAAAASASGAAGSAEAQTDAPDGLTLPAGHTPSSSHAHGAARPEAAAYARPEPRINVPHIAVEIARSIQNGISRFEIRLNPPELGRVDVRIEMDKSGNVVARLAVERSETLDLLQRDQRALERALTDAGLDGNKTDLEFSLRQENQGGGQPPERNHWTASVAADPAAAEPSILPPDAMRGYARLDAVNLWV